MTRDPYKYFRIEARELVAGLHAGVLELERSPATSQAVARLLRLAHTLKGAARVVRQAGIAELAHRIEDVLARYRDGGALVPSAVADLLAIVDGLSSQLRQLDGPAPEGPTTERTTPASPSQGDDRFEAVRVAVTDLDRVLQGLLELDGRVGMLRAALEGPGGVAASRAQLDSLSRELGALHQEVGELRLVPAISIQAGLDRAARDAAAALGKRVQLEWRGADVRIDAHVLAGVQQAMQQVVRNAVAHGVEDEAARVRAGKRPVGTIAVTVERRGARVTLRCTDDGRGIDVDLVRRAALARGRLTEAEAAALDLPGAIDLLLRGGLSTASAVTEVAGRGVGLDVVRDVVARLAGEVDATSEPGRTTTVTLTVPVTLSSFAAVLVQVGELRYLIPMEAVEAARREGPDATSASRATDQPEGLVHEGAAVRFAPLADLLGRRSTTAAPRGAWSCVIVTSRGLRVALGVDRVLGVTQAVLRPLPPSIGRAPLVGGAAIGADGTPLLVLDPPSLVEAALGHQRAAAVSPPARLPLLIIDDSLTTRMLEQTILTSAGYEVDLATSAEEGLELARLRRYGVFVVDVEMPGMDGFEFVARTRADPDLRGTPAVLVTSRDAAEDRRRGAAAGASAYIVKQEFEEGRLLEVVARLLGAA